ncbi:MAG TPA: hypothetical protein VKI19_05485 [Acidimicrobiales bacterium]|nr:hypothetical protein [Acidimicrobiales bacterium]
MTGRLFSPRALTLHVLLAVTVVLCTVAAWWQVDRALSGHALSWLYVVEWPAFGGIAAWLWWVLVTRPDPPAAGRRRPTAGRTAGELSWDPALESPRLRAYNAYLGSLGRGERAARPR